MDTLLGNIYCWFETLFGQNLAEHLWGFDGNEYTLSNIYNSVGLIALVISLFFVLFYYYIFNHPAFNKWWSWLIVLLINGVANMLVGYFWTASDYLNGHIADNLMYARGEDGEITAYLITKSDCWGFGAANLLVATIFFIILTFCLKWWSRNCKHSPWI